MAMYRVLIKADISVYHFLVAQAVAYYEAHEKMKSECERFHANYQMQQQRKSQLKAKCTELEADIRAKVGVHAFWNSSCSCGGVEKVILMLQPVFVAVPPHALRSKPMPNCCKILPRSSRNACRSLNKGTPCVRVLKRHSRTSCVSQSSCKINRRNCRLYSLSWRRVFFLCVLHGLKQERLLEAFLVQGLVALPCIPSLSTLLIDCCAVDAGRAEVPERSGG